jgi:hypothetical protein
MKMQQSCKNYHIRHKLHLMNMQYSGEQGAERLDAFFDRTLNARIDEGASAAELRVFDAARPAFDDLICSGTVLTAAAVKQLEYRNATEGMTLMVVRPGRTLSGYSALAGRKILVPRLAGNNSNETYLSPAAVSLDSTKLGRLKVTSLNSPYGYPDLLDKKIIFKLSDDQRMLLDAAIASEAPSIGSHDRAGFTPVTLRADFEHAMPSVQALIDPTIGTHAGHQMRAYKPPTSYSAALQPTQSVISSLSGEGNKKALLEVGMQTKVIEPSDTFVFFYHEGLENSESISRPLDLTEGALRRVQGLVAFALGDRIEKLNETLAT